MPYETITELMGEILARDARELEPDFLLNDDSAVELIDIAKLAMACEGTWGIVLHDEEVAQWRTLGDVAAHVARLLEEGQAEPVEREDDDRLAWYYE